MHVNRMPFAHTINHLIGFLKLVSYSYSFAILAVDRVHAHSPKCFLSVSVAGLYSVQETELRCTAEADGETI